MVLSLPQSCPGPRSTNLEEPLSRLGTRGRPVFYPRDPIGVADGHG
jgi:hypothetical protein